ncbi:hypothetical protein NDU88_008583 [Pleurodeles waltl]|uniref:Uncharacterized protein n=1 Tax=Pleurodeles waltl TaxID=8319 RepID=A0AAV7NZN0_PLEWA|nr:hypothetical protein NDU88_008583 [Pleurodeles waltl]
MGKINKRRDMANEAGDHRDDLVSLPAESARSAATEAPSLGDIMQGITSTRESLELKIDTLTLDLGLLWEDQRRLAERVATTEKTVEELKPTLATTGDQVTALEKQVGTPMVRAKDTENRSRRNNIRVIGLPSKVEGQDLTEYLER